VGSDRYLRTRCPALSCSETAKDALERLTSTSVVTFTIELPLAATI